MPTVSGTVKDSTGAFAQRLVRVLDRKNCSVLGTALSDATTGAYSISVPTTSEVMVVANDTSDADPFWSSVVLALHFDGSNGSTVFTDEKGKTVTANGNAQISTVQYKFGGASAYFDGSGDYLTVSSSADFAFGTDDFTIEAWVNIAAAPAAGNGYSLFTNSSTLTLPAVFFISDANKLALWANGLVGNTGSTVPLGQWSHVAFVRSGGTAYAFINGVAQWSAAYTANHAENIGLVGCNPDKASGFFNGYIDDLRVTKGVARYVANFTPPTAAFPNSLAGGTENAVILDRVVPV